MIEWLKSIVTFFFGVKPGTSQPTSAKVVSTKAPVANKSSKRVAKKPAAKKAKK